LLENLRARSELCRFSGLVIGVLTMFRGKAADFLVLCAITVLFAPGGCCLFSVLLSEKNLVRIFVDPLVLPHDYVKFHAASVPCTLSRFSCLVGPLKSFIFFFFFFFFFTSQCSPLFVSAPLAYRSLTGGVRENCFFDHLQILPLSLRPNQLTCVFLFFWHFTPSFFTDTGARLGPSRHQPFRPATDVLLPSKIVRQFFFPPPFPYFSPHPHCGLPFVYMNPLFLSSMLFSPLR